MPLILDTGPLLAALDASDEHHEACSALIAGADEARMIPAPVLVELDYFLTREFGPKPMRLLLGDVRAGAFEIEPLTATDYARVSEIMARYQDMRVGFVDAAVLAIVERRREPKLATLDRRHFAVMRPAHVTALELLPT
ncbi:MAG: type II toxin-antitoxin system VapC family toxin [Solirubrobacteraceae bacterium]